jgi:hypothetical protein
MLHPSIHPVPNFTGRREALASLHAALSAANSQAALVGSGGVGKSALAVQYAWENRERYAGVWRLEADTESSICIGLAQLGARFIPGMDEMPELAVAAQRALIFLEQTRAAKPWLLIYHNVANPKSLDGLTPRAGAHVLMTSHVRDWSGPAKPVPLGEFTPEEAVQYLLGRTGRTDEAGAARLAATLRHLPLMLNYAAAFCVETGDSFDGYGQRLADWITNEDLGFYFPQICFGVISLALDEATAACPEAKTLTDLLAYMARDNIPCGIVAQAAMNAKTLHEAVRALSRVALVTVNGEGEDDPLVSVHGIVQTVRRGRLKSDAAANAALVRMAEAFPAGIDSSDVRSRRYCERLYRHAVAVLEHAPERGELAGVTASLLSRVAQFLHSRACYIEAEPLIRRSLAIAETILGPAHPEVAVRLKNLARLLTDTNRPAEAEPLMRRALAIEERTFGPDCRAAIKVRTQRQSG